MRLLLLNFNNILGIMNELELYKKWNDAFYDFYFGNNQDNVVLYVDNEIIKSMYMLLKHIHDMYMSRHARIVNISCTTYVHVWLTYT